MYIKGKKICQRDVEMIGAVSNQLAYNEWNFLLLTLTVIAVNVAIGIFFCFLTELESNTLHTLATQLMYI